LANKNKPKKKKNTGHTLTRCLRSKNVFLNPGWVLENVQYLWAKQLSSENENRLWFLLCSGSRDCGKMKLQVWV